MNRFFIAKKFFNQFYKKNYSVSNPEKLNSSKFKMFSGWELYFGSCAWGVLLVTIVGYIDPYYYRYDSKFNLFLKMFVPPKTFIATLEVLDSFYNRNKIITITFPHMP